MNLLNTPGYYNGPKLETLELDLDNNNHLDIIHTLFLANKNDKNFNIGFYLKDKINGNLA